MLSKLLLVIWGHDSCQCIHNGWVIREKASQASRIHLAHVTLSVSCFEKAIPHLTFQQRHIRWIELRFLPIHNFFNAYLTDFKAMLKHCNHLLEYINTNKLEFHSLKSSSQEKITFCRSRIKAEILDDLPSLQQWVGEQETDTLAPVLSPKPSFLCLCHSEMILHMSWLGNMKNMCNMQNSRWVCILESIIIYEILKPKEIACN